MALIKLLDGDSVVNRGIYNIVGTIRKDYAALGEPNQGSKMHGLLEDLAFNRGAAKGTDIKELKAAGGFTRTEKWVHDGHNVMHYSTGEKNKDARTHSVTLFFYEGDKEGDDKVWVIIAAGHHTNASKDYKIVWGARKGDYATV